MLCVGRLRNTYLSDPGGHLAARALYMEGVLYKRLYLSLNFKSDHRAARENFDEIIDTFPNSPFAHKAAAELRAMSALLPPTQRIRKAEAAFPNNPKDLTTGESNLSSTQQHNNARPLAVLHQLHYWSDSSYTRVVVHTEQEVRYSHHILKNDDAANTPPKLYIDMDQSTLSEKVKPAINVDDNLLTRVRVARHTPISVRVVLDLKSFASYKVFALHDPFRIVIDVYGNKPTVSEHTGEPLSRNSSNKHFNSISRGTLARQLALGVKRIVIDPGHGGKDFGAPGFFPGVHEKDIVLSISKRVAARVRESLGLEAILTRTGDRYLTLEERTALANARKADLFVSIHTNASRNPRAYGIETYFLNLATDDESIRVAAMENATSKKNISDIHSILNELMRNAKISESRGLAGTVQKALIEHLTYRGYRRVKDKGVKQAPFYVLLGARMPSILIETSFISNPDECRLLVTSPYQNHLAESIVSGIKGYIKAINPEAIRASKGSSLLVDAK